MHSNHNYIATSLPSTFSRNSLTMIKTQVTNVDNCNIRHHTMTNIVYTAATDRRHSIIHTTITQCYRGAYTCMLSLILALRVKGQICSRPFDLENQLKHIIM